MAKPLRILIQQARRYLTGDHLQLEVDGQVQTDRIDIWGAERSNLGWGHGDLLGAGPWGDTPVMGWGHSDLFGAGPWGEGVRIIERRTSASFVAGDYTLRLRAVDRLGNAGDWSTPHVHQHRPQPPAPRSLRIAGGNLSWRWSDPA